jgi:hypothetical protein
MGGADRCLVRARLSKGADKAQRSGPEDPVWLGPAPWARTTLPFGKHGRVPKGGSKHRKMVSTASDRLAEPIDEPIQACRDTTGRKLLTDSPLPIPVGWATTGAVPVFALFDYLAAPDAVIRRHKRITAVRQVFGRIPDQPVQDVWGT